MKDSRVPKKLQHNLIVEAVFEMRFSIPESTSEQQIASQIMTKLLQSHVHKTASEDAQPIVRQNDMAMIPMEIRMQDTNLKYAPLFFLENILDYKVAFGDHMLAIVHNMPYKGWEFFKNQILDIIQEISSVLSRNKVYVERHSLRYADYVHNGIGGDLFKLLDINMFFGERNLMKSPFNLRTENHEDKNIIVQEVVFPVHINPSSDLSGVLIATDTVQIVNKLYENCSYNPSGDLEEMHSINKEYFFQTLTEYAKEKLGAEYE